MKALTLLVLVSTLSWAAPPPGEVVIATRDGQRRMGRILSETSEGYLLAGATGSEIIAFASITQISPAPSEAMTPTVETTREAPRATDWVEARRGVHLGLGASLMALPVEPVYVNSTIQLHLDWTIGRVSLRGSLGVMATQYDLTYIIPTVELGAQVNVSRVYAFGLGGQLGVTVPGKALITSPVITPVIIKLGDRGEHQLQLSVAIQVRHDWGGIPKVGLPTGGLGYTYLF